MDAEVGLGDAPVDAAEVERCPGASPGVQIVFLGKNLWTKTLVVA